MPVVGGCLRTAYRCTAVDANAVWPGFPAHASGLANRVSQRVFSDKVCCFSLCLAVHLHPLDNFMFGCQHEKILCTVVMCKDGCLWGVAGGVQQGGSRAASAAAARAPAAQHRALRQDLALPVPRHPSGAPNAARIPPNPYHHSLCLRVWHRFTPARHRNYRRGSWNCCIICWRWLCCAEW